MAVNPKGYTATIKKNKEQIAAVICVAYDLGNSAQFAGIDFYQFMSKGDAVPLPSGRELSFQEELRCLGKSSATVPGGRTNEKEFIRSKMEEAYGVGVSVKISVID